jgi:glycyl-tRNA synthetase (class II)
VDTQSIGDDTVTVRERDTLKQVRVSAGSLAQYLGERISG